MKKQLLTVVAITAALTGAYAQSYKMTIGTTIAARSSTIPPTATCLAGVLYGGSPTP